MSRPHICFVAPGAYPSLVPVEDAHVAGGAEIQQARLMRLFAADGMRVSLISLDFGQPEQCDVDGIDVHRLPSQAGRSFKGLRWLVPRLTDVVALLNRLKPDIVYVRTTTAYLAPAAWYARRCGKKLIFAAASDLDFGNKSRQLMSWRDAALFRLGIFGVDTFLLQNHAQVELLRQRFDKPGRVIPNLHSEANPGTGSPDGPILWVGTVTPHKRPEIFIEVAKRLPSLKFVLIGGPGAIAGAQTYYENIVAWAEVLPNLRVVGFVPPSEVGRWFDGAAALVNTSSAEGFPNTFLQAWLRGVPSISFVRPAVEDGVSYTLSCSDVADMVQQLEQLVGDSKRWHARSFLCQQALHKHHSPAAVLPLYRTVFGENAAT